MKNIDRGTSKSNWNQNAKMLLLKSENSSLENEDIHHYKTLIKTDATSLDEFKKELFAGLDEDMSDHNYFSEENIKSHIFAKVWSERTNAMLTSHLIANQTPYKLVNIYSSNRLILLVFKAE